MPLTALTARLAAAGLDLARPFDVAAYNAQVAGPHDLPPLPTFGRPDACGLLVGNTRALWPPFIAWLDADPTRRALPHPLDAYVTAQVAAAVATLPCAAEPRFAHDAGPRRVAMLRLSALAGLARPGPIPLAIHPTHGPWFALRAALALDLPAPPAPPPTTHPCDGCPAPCRPAWTTTLAAGHDPAHPARAWPAWATARAACPVGAASRYGPNQTRYHYTHDAEALRGD